MKDPNDIEDKEVSVQPVSFASLASFVSLPQAAHAA
jgi:hypothetical protein